MRGRAQPVPTRGAGEVSKTCRTPLHDRACTNIEVDTPTAVIPGNAFRVAPVAAVPAVAAVPRVPAVRARPAARGRPAVPARAAVPAIPGTPAVAAVPGHDPAELRWWSYVTLSSVYDATSELPLEAMWQRSMAAPDRTSIAARDDPASRVQAVSATLYRHLTLTTLRTH